MGEVNWRRRSSPLALLDGNSKSSKGRMAGAGPFTRWKCNIGRPQRGYQMKRKSNSLTVEIRDKTSWHQFLGAEVQIACSYQMMQEHKYRYNTGHTFSEQMPLRKQQTNY